jgi:plasmid stabilization system protein ParE
VDFRIAFSQRSLTDLREILEHIAEDNAPVAEKFAADLAEKAKSLRRFPFRIRAIASGQACAKWRWAPT